MLKKTFALLLAALLTLSAFAFAAETDLELVSSDGSKVYLAGEALSGVTVSEVLTANIAYAVYTAEQETAEDDDAGFAIYCARSSTVGLQEGEEPPAEEVSPSAKYAVWDESDTLVYFVNTVDPKALRSFDPSTSESKVLVETESDITALRLSTEGLLVATGDAEMLYIHDIRQMVAPVYDSRAQEIKVGDGFDALLDTQEVLRIRNSGETEAMEIAQGAVAYLVQDTIVHYIARENDVFTLYSYLTELDSTVLQGEYPEPILPVMTMSESDIYAYSASGIVYDFQIVTGDLAPLNDEPFALDAPVLRVYGDYVLVYDDSAEASESFIAALHNSGITQESDGDEAFIEEAEEEVAPEPTSTPMVEMTLSRGMRGDEVKKLQQLLNKHGYDCGKADGIFGQGTETALKLLQGDMGLEETGVATAKLREQMEKGDIPEYKAYVDLATGDTGIRVQRLQERLRTLGYMTAPAGGHYYDETTAAVKRFQKQIGYKVTGNITAKQMKGLFKKDASECTEYYQLKKDDSSPMVKRLNSRLKELGYLNGSVNESYSKSTSKAVKLFCTFNGLSKTQSSSCTAKLQKRIFAEDAPKYEEEPSPEPTEKPEKKAWRLPTKKELKVVYNWMKKNMSMDQDVAVQRIQLRLAELGYLDEALVSGEYDEATSEAVYHFQAEVLGKTTVKGIAGKPTLKALFEDVN